MSDVRITTSDAGRIVLASPYHPDFSPEARKLGGKWDRDGRVWVFDPRTEDRVRQLVIEFFGTDGSPQMAANLVTVRLAVPEARAPQRGGDAAFYALGRMIAERRSRDEDVRLGDGVVLVSGRFAGSGGSMAYPELYPKDAVVEVYDVPRAAVDALTDSEREDWSVRIVSAEEIDRAKLEAEKARLLERVAEIDALLSGTDA